MGKERDCKKEGLNVMKVFFALGREREMEWILGFGASDSDGQQKLTIFDVSSVFFYLYLFDPPCLSIAHIL